MEAEVLIEALRTRALIRRNISTRKSVQEGKPDRIADLLEEAASTIEGLLEEKKTYKLACESAAETLNFLRE